MRENKKNKTSWSARILPYFQVAGIAAIMISLVLPSIHVSAINRSDKKIEVYTIVSNDPYINDTLKTKVIYQLVNENSLNLNSIDINSSTVSVSGLNVNKPGVQAVTLRVNLVKFDSTDKALGYSVTENAVINVVKSAAPVLKLKKSSVVVNNGDVWNASSYITTVFDDSGTLPVLKEIDNVNMNEDGEYYASYIAVNAEGNSTSAILNVTVKTPQEVIDAREDAERQAEEEAEAEAEAAAEAEREARRRAASTIANVDLSKLGSFGGGINTALSMVGIVPYVWGGSSPATGFDCSGLVQYCYGLTARTSYQMQALGTHRYDVENAPAGALYFYGSDSTPYHVSISLGGGSSVQAMNPSRGIQVVSNASFMPSYYVVIGQ